ncbi:MAG TPA: tetratricopeptide repeat protein [Gammaproteobacteria bacterium]|nr:tetratricopeptide repeat protein [Gammaproteobacteria bacterium]
MTDPLLYEDDETAKLKDWWKKNGHSIIAGVVLGLIIVVGVNYWRNYQTSQAEEASVLFEQVASAVVTKKPEQAVAAGARLMSDFKGSGYAAKAALLLAKISVDKKDFASAENQLRWAIDNAADKATAMLTRLRLVELLLAQRKWDAAGALLEQVKGKSFASRRAELQGDLAMARGRRKVAYTAYTDALASLDQAASYRDILVMKRDHAGSQK